MNRIIISLNNMIEYINCSCIHQFMKLFWGTIIFIATILYQNSTNIEKIKPLSPDVPSTCDEILATDFYEKNISSLEEYSSCRIMEYSNEDIGRCFSYTREASKLPATWIVAIGDSKLRQLYEYSIDRLSFMNLTKERKFYSSKEFPPYKNQIGIHRPFSSSSTQYKFQFDFYWNIFLSANEIHDLLTYFQTKKSPDVLILGSDIHYLRVLAREPLQKIYEKFRKELKNTIQMVNRLQNNSRIFWKIAEALNPESKSEDHLNNINIDNINDIAREELNGSRVQVFNLPRVTLNINKDYTDFVHYSYKTRGKIFQGILNYMCNEYQHKKADQDLCCSREEFEKMENFDSSANSEMKHEKFIVITLFRISACMTFIITVCHGVYSKYYQLSTNEGEVLPTCSAHLFSITLIILKLTIIFSYIAMCDKYPIFSAVDKTYSGFTFVVPIILLAVVGCATLQQSESEDKFLNRKLTDEWKGWMQLCILVYHYTGASEVLPIYIFVRVLVSSYVFMTGFGHCVYVCNKKTLNLKRYIMVMFRLNFGTVMLCLVMNQPYINYYFVPLISFWFTVAYLASVLAVNGAGKDDLKMRLWFMVTVLIVLISLISETLDDSFGQYKHLSANSTVTKIMTYDNEWMFRWKLDRYSIIYGLVLALIWAYKDDRKFLMEATKKTLSVSALSACVVMSLLYTLIVCSHGNKFTYNRMHPWIVWMPIGVFVILRNLSATARSYHSKFFVWCGSISLELFILQYHILLADNTHTTLVIVPHSPLVNLILTAMVFVMVSVELRDITNQLVSYLTKFFSPAAPSSIS